MIEIIEIQQPMTQGKTQPWLCVGDNDKRYVVKRRNANFTGCLYEWVAANLGQKLGLNIPNPELVYIDQGLMEYDKELEWELGAGTAFASSFESNLTEINYQQLLATEPNILLKLFLFDYWIKNDDRTLTEKGGNPNLYLNLQSNEIVIFDHNLAFDNSFDFDEFKHIHVSAYLFKGQTDFLNPICITQEIFQSKLEEAFKELDTIFDTVPEDWVENIADFTGECDKIKVILKRFKDNNFWEALK